MTGISLVRGFLRLKRRTQKYIIEFCANIWWYHVIELFIFVFLIKLYTKSFLKFKTIDLTFSKCKLYNEHWSSKATSDLLFVFAPPFFLFNIRNTTKRLCFFVADFVVPRTIVSPEVLCGSFAKWWIRQQTKAVFKITVLSFYRSFEPTVCTNDIRVCGVHIKKKKKRAFQTVEPNSTCQNLPRDTILISSQNNNIR